MIADDFDPHAHYQHRMAQPEGYVTMRSIWEDAKVLHEFRHARTVDDLKRHYTGAAKRLKAEGDLETLKLITAAKDRRKKELET